MLERMADLFGGNELIMILVLLPVLVQVVIGVLYLVADSLGGDQQGTAR